MNFTRHLRAGALAFALSTTALTGAMAQDASLDLVEPLAQYKIYVAENTAELVKDTEAFVKAIKDGDVEKAKELFAPTRTSYEAVEPIAELFSDLDVSIDARADDYEKGEEDPTFTGFHRLEYGLWEEGSTEGLDEYADQLMEDVKELNSRINELTFPPETVVGGAAALMEEVAATKISGEEDRYSRTDLWDFKANFDGAYKIFDLLKPVLEEKDSEEFLKTVQGNFDDVYEVLEEYETDEGGYVSYTKLSDEDRNLLSTKVNTLAEDLSTLRGKLGLG
ncbi:iron uptake system protein EfeO [Afifella marina]|uniref:Iron uptake system component EfeO n=1 Tax=Afifella marina DSM 2698 TaxID=1120955 RepID=A0A1G5PAD6_AFIMA|nr:iron uptake system protein EfeO [Afifella marina]MBK1624353.1 iron uptake system protein EfeO [Afifella marina DSM 2698]MBK1628085.1 iron uptake system protein EfeO [Afifella marina]MBK5916519.1 EfeM/EfeO family lipoprotein [Afifella marina]RAI18894.1 EfeM/EfeO family lipoprotein [Afifella marina DSM 2698]SCZ46258.1 iron uptake system component EfeO [Afifella marina DSM 2698]